MSGISRRGLFSLLGGRVSRATRETDASARPVKAEAKRRDGFSLQSFYARRAAAPGSIPRFDVRDGDLASETTNVGMGAPEDPSREPPKAREAASTVDVAGFDGFVRILPEACLGYSSFCSVCVERCPVEGAIVVELGRPRVVESACDGCGICVRACPAPMQALRIVPRGSKPRVEPR